MGVKPEKDEAGLTFRQREVLDLLKGGATQAEIGRLLGVTRQQIGQIVKRLREDEWW